jgi:hypothetical protein
MTRSIANRPQSKRHSYKPLLMRFCLASGLLVAAVFAMLGADSTRPALAAIGGKKKTSVRQASVRAPSTAQVQDLVVGTWQDDYQGHRTLTVRPDGTATMIVEFDGWKARMFTPRLQIETTWTIDEGRFNRQTVGGAPRDKVEFVKKRVGDRASDTIVKVTAERMILVDQDGETRYEWRRVR